MRPYYKIPALRVRLMAFLLRIPVLVFQIHYGMSLQYRNHQEGLPQILHFHTLCQL
jgi:hypothetical protein